MTKYEALDRLIMNQIGGHPQPFTIIYAKEAVYVECKRINDEDRKDAGDAFRVLDRRLQALRKAGKIRSTKKGWVREAT
jgi:hypothetical protein